MTITGILFSTRGCEHLNVANYPEIPQMLKNSLVKV
jgi:hypothetical protein